MKYVILTNERYNNMYIKLSVNIIYSYIYNNISKNIIISNIYDYVNNKNINNGVFHNLKTTTDKLSGYLMSKDRMDRDVQSQHESVEIDNTTYISHSFVLYNFIDLFIKSSLIIINMDNYKHCSFEELILNKINKSDLNISIFDYNPLNIKNIINEYKFIKIYYMPLVFDKYLIDYYNNFNLKKINFYEKEYDILFYGTLNERRSKILDELSKKYKVNILSVISPYLYPDEELINSIENSKIVLNIYFYEHNKIFDYYRNSFLIANNALLISEYPDDIDFNIEKNLEDIENNIILSKYDDIITAVDFVLNKDHRKSDDRTSCQYNWFSKFDSKYFYDKFFKK